HKIGVVGLKTSIEAIIELAEEYKTELEFISFSYEETEEVEKIVREHNSHVHAWLFSGPLPYEIAKKTLDTDKIMVHVPATESGFYRYYLEMIYEQGKIIEQLSIDTMLLNNISEEATSQINLKIPKVYTKEYDLNVDT